MGLAGRVGCAGDAVNPPPGSGPAAGGCAFGRLRSSASQAKRPHPWGLDGAIHGANGPANPPHPAPDSFLRGPPRNGRRKAKATRVARCALQKGQKQRGTRRSRVPLSNSVPTTQCSSIRHRETVRGGADWVRGTAGAMDGAYEPPWMGSRRVPRTQPAPPSAAKSRAAFDVSSCSCCCLPQAAPRPPPQGTTLRSSSPAPQPDPCSCPGSSHAATAWHPPAAPASPRTPASTPP